MTPSIREEQESDRDAIWAINRSAFGQDCEGQLIDALRSGGFLSLSLVAESQGQLVGHVAFSDLAIVDEDARVDALALAPVAVVPEFQSNGIGSKLIRRGLEVCRSRGHRIVIVLGEPDYYHRFGFSSALASPLMSPYQGPAFQATELVPGALEGVGGKVEYSQPFNEF